VTIPTIRQHLSDLKHNRVSSIELCQDYLARIHASQHNAFISVNEDAALQAAKAVDESRSKGATPPLAGIPLAHKDIFCIEGTRTTAGSRMLDNFIAPYTATVVEKLVDAGCISLGKTNMDEFAMGSSNENSYFGDVINPWSTEQTLVPGGSSGGSAAAVAAQLVPATTGTDTGGSIRQPAAFCGLTGVKPSYGRCSRYGMIAFASSLDQAGPITHSAEDAALLLNVMAGFDEKDATSLQTDAEDFTRSLSDDLSGLKIGVPEEFFKDGLDHDIAQCVQEAIKVYEALGASVKSVSLPHVEQGLAAYYVVAPAEASANLSRFDGVRYGYRTEHYQDLNELYVKSRSEGFGDEVKRRIMIGTYALSSGYYDAYYSKAQKLRRLIANDFAALFDDVDVIMGPTTPTPAFAHGSRTHDPVAMYLNDIYTIPVNLAGLPAASIPCGLTSDGLPVGLHLITAYLNEAKLLNIAHQFQCETDWHLRAAPSVGGQA